MLDPDFALQVLLADVKSQVFLLVLALFLKGGRCPQGGIKGDIRVIAGSGAGLDVAPSFLFCFGLGAPSGLFALEVIQRAGELLWFKPVADPGFLSPFPPVSITGVKDILLAGFRRFQLLISFPDPVR
jgi:hypothetical protein